VETDRDDLDALAGEYVLGTLPDDERRAAEARYAADPGFRRSVSAWEMRLQPLADAAGEVPVAASLRDRVLGSIAAADAPPAVDAGTISVRRVAEAAPPDKSYELWSIAPNEAQKSLGLVEQVSFSQPLSVTPAGDVTLAITLEPKGGSPTGAPTSAPIFSGTLVATEE